MKVVRVDNYDNEGPRGTHRLIAAGLTEDEAERLAKSMNENPKRADEDYFRAVPDDEKLFVFEP